MSCQTLKRQTKIFRIAHDDPGPLHLDFIVLPVGYSYNADIREAKSGDIIRLADGTTGVIHSVRVVDMKKPAADLLCRIRYGISLKGALMRWRINARLEGHGEKAISEDECLWVIYSKDEQD